MSCSAARRDAINVIGTAGPGEEPCSRISPPVTSAFPKNPGLEFYYESTPDQRGYSPNLTGTAFVDPGVGSFLRKLKSLSGQLNPDSEWVKLATKFDNKFHPRYTCTVREHSTLFDATIM
jgi:hypothetical protein